MQRNDAGNNLVKLELVDIMDIDPMPDKAMQGRLARMLKQVGAQGNIAVRARMITSVSNTKFKNRDGHPISLVGLHGKDELLVRGPAWAIEEIGRGRTPDTEQYISQLSARKALLTELLKVIDSSERPQNLLASIQDVLLDADQLDASAKTVLKQQIGELLTDLSMVLERSESGSIPWWYFWSTWWTEQEEHFCLEYGRRMLSEAILPRGHSVGDINIVTMEFATSR